MHWRDWFSGSVRGFIRATSHCSLFIIYFTSLWLSDNMKCLTCLRNVSFISRYRLKRQRTPPFAPSSTSSITVSTLLDCEVDVSVQENVWL